MLASVGTVAVTAEPAAAYTYSCEVDGAWWLPNRCTTPDSVEANHTCDCITYLIYVFSGCEVEWKIVDARNQAVVYSARTGPMGPGYIFGLYSWYYLTVKVYGLGCGGHFEISND
jgi:hypothetical protein